MWQHEGRNVWQQEGRKSPSHTHRSEVLGGRASQRRNVKDEHGLALVVGHRGALAVKRVGGKVIEGGLRRTGQETRA